MLSKANKFGSFDVTDHPLRGPMLKVDRVKAKLDEADELSRRLFDGVQLNLHIETDPVSLDRRLMVRPAKSIQATDEIYALVAEMAYHLRSALDQMLVAIANNAGAKNLRIIEFPFAGSLADFTGKGTQKKINQLPADVQAMLSDLQPYKGGNDVLWGLSKLSNIDKHRGLVPVASSASIMRMVINGITITNAKSGFVLGGGMFSLEDGLELANLGRDGQFSMMPGGLRLEAGGNFAFGDVDVFAGKSALGTIYQLSQIVGDIIKNFDAHCFGAE